MFLNFGVDKNGVLGRFANASIATGFALDDDTRAIAKVDWDGDGALDIWLNNRTSPRLRFFRNTLPAGAAWLAVKVEGTTCNRDAIGARLELTPPSGRKLFGARRCGEGFLSQNSAWVHFGFAGEKPGPVQLTVHWPDGKAEVFKDLASGQRWVVKQGTATPGERRFAVVLVQRWLSPYSCAFRIALVASTGFRTMKYSLVVAALLACCVANLLCAQALFLRGDANDDGKSDLSDAICTLTVLFQAEPGGPCSQPICFDSLDVNDDGHADISDPISLLNYLFLGADPPPEPFLLGCGKDPTDADGLGCNNSLSCATEPTFTLVTPPATKLYTIWSEAFNTTGSMHRVLSILHLKPGTLRVRSRGDTQALRWIESLDFGPDLVPAETLGDGIFRYNPALEYSHEYTQAFRTPLGDWTFVLRSNARGWTSKTTDCAFFDGQDAFNRNPAFWAEINLTGGQKIVQYACFLEGTWMPAGNSPVRFTLDDATKIEVHIDETYFFRGTAGETSNQRIVKAIVEIQGQRLEITAYDRLIYAARHHNAAQEYRLLFAASDGDVHGVDIVTCPDGEPDCGIVFGLSGSRAFYLNAALERARAVKVIEARAGG